MERLADLDELTLRCRSEQGRRYIAEAVDCYRAAAYRACIVSTWIAVVFDVVDKLRELAITGDGRAKIRLAEFEKNQEHLNRGDHTAIEAALKFEREILEVARDELQLIDQHQFLDLERLRQDRHRCAHPTFQKIEDPYSPSAELARLHLRNAILHLLQQQPVQGKAALNELKALIESSYFSFELDKAKLALQESSIRRPTDALVRNFVDYLFFGIFAEDGPLRTRAKAVAALQATLEFHPRIAEDRYSKQLNTKVKSLPDADMPSLLALIGVVSSSWDFLTEANRAKALEFIKKGPSDQLARTLHFVAYHPALRESVEKRIRSFGVDELALVVQRSYGMVVHGSKGPTEAILDRIAELYSAAKSWDAANTVADRLIFLVMTQLGSKRIETILQASQKKGSGLVGSRSLAKFIDTIRSSNLMPARKLTGLLKAYNLSEYMLQGKTSGAADQIPF